MKYCRTKISEKKRKRHSLVILNRRLIVYKALKIVKMHDYRYNTLYFFFHRNQKYSGSSETTGVKLNLHLGKFYTGVTRKNLTRWKIVLKPFKLNKCVPRENKILMNWNACPTFWCVKAICSKLGVHFHFSMWTVTVLSAPVTISKRPKAKASPRRNHFVVLVWLTFFTIFKKGDKHQPANNRPVSLISINCKLLEHIMYSNVQHFDNHHVLCDNQHGFRKLRSCGTQLISTFMNYPHCNELYKASG